MPAYALSEDTYTVDKSKMFIPFRRGIDDIRQRPGSLLVDIVPFLIQTAKHNILIDPGLGLNLANGNYHILENLLTYGLSAYDIDIVLLSHLHKDHFSGCVITTEHDKLTPMFPNAIHYVQQGELDYASGIGSLSYEKEKIDFYHQHELFQTINGNIFIDEGIMCEISGGHTPYHQVFIIKDESRTYFYGGDVLPQPQQLIRRFVAKYDYDGKQSADKRIEYGHRIAKENMTALYFHSGLQPISRVSFDGEKFSII